MNSIARRISDVNTFQVGLPRSVREVLSDQLGWSSLIRLSVHQKDG